MILVSVMIKNRKYSKFKEQKWDNGDDRQKQGLDNRKQAEMDRRKTNRDIEEKIIYIIRR